MVRAASVRPGGRLVIQAVEVQVSVLEPVSEALVSIRGLGGRHPVDQDGPGALLVAEAVGVLAERAAGRVGGRTGLRPVGALCFRVLAGGPGTRALTALASAYRPAHAGVVDGSVDEGLAVGEALADRVLVLQRAADLGVTDLLLHQHAALKRRPRNPVVDRRGV